MPIYEFYCSKCNTLYNFFSKTMATKKRPACPRCGKKQLEKQISAFAMTGRAKEGGGMDDLPIDESKMERAISSLASQAEGMKDDDPRQAAQLMRKFSDMTGIQYGKGMAEALHRMESGEDPEAIEKEMGDLMDGEEEPIILPGQKGGGGSRSRRAAPTRDPTLYDM